jgi:hypothetical protein
MDTRKPNSTFGLGYTFEAIHDANYAPDQCERKLSRKLQILHDGVRERKPAGRVFRTPDLGLKPPYLVFD